MVRRKSHNNNIYNIIIQYASAYYYNMRIPSYRCINRWPTWVTIIRLYYMFCQKRIFRSRSGVLFCAVHAWKRVKRAWKPEGSVELDWAAGNRFWKTIILNFLAGSVRVFDGETTTIWQRHIFFFKDIWHSIM